MKIYFCAKGNDVHVLVFDNRFSKQWRKEVSFCHVNDDGHRVLKTLRIADPVINGIVEDYIEQSEKNSGAPNVLLQRVMELGFEAGREGYAGGLLLSDLTEVFRPHENPPQSGSSSARLLHKNTDSRIDEEIPVHVLLHLYKIAFSVGEELKGSL